MILVVFAIVPFVAVASNVGIIIIINIIILTLIIIIIILTVIGLHSFLLLSGKWASDIGKRQH